MSASILSKAFNAVESNPSDAVRYIRRLQRSSLREQLQAKDAIVQAMVIALRPTVPAPFLKEAVAIWKRLKNVIPRLLCEVRYFSVFSWLCHVSQTIFDNFEVTVM